MDSGSCSLHEMAERRFQLEANSTMAEMAAMISWIGGCWDVGRGGAWRRSWDDAGIHGGVDDLGLVDDFDGDNDAVDKEKGLVHLAKLPRPRRWWWTLHWRFHGLALVVINQWTNNLLLN